MLRLLTLTFVLPAFAFFIPVNDGFVTDTVGVLSSSQEEKLEQYLNDYQRETTNEITVVIVDTLGDTPAADAALEIGRAWGVGTEENDNGIVMLIAYEDREVYIATGYGLEGAVPDIVAKGIVDTDLVPNFREGNFYEGIFAGLDSLKKHIGGEYSSERYESTYDGGGGGGFVFLLFFFFIILGWLASVLGRTKSWWLGGVIGLACGAFLTLLYMWWLSIPIITFLGLLFDYLVSKNYRSRGKTSWWAGGDWGPGGSSGSSSGGFGGFSGGSFGGGGAGGSW